MRPSDLYIQQAGTPPRHPRRRLFPLLFPSQKYGVPICTSQLAGPVAVLPPETPIPFSPLPPPPPWPCFFLFFLSLFFFFLHPLHSQYLPLGIATDSRISRSCWFSIYFVVVPPVPCLTRWRFSHFAAPFSCASPLRTRGEFSVSRQNDHPGTHLSSEKHKLPCQFFLFPLVARVRNFLRVAITFQTRPRKP